MSASDAAERLVAVASSLRLRPAWLDQQRDQIGSNLSVEQAADRLLQRLAVADLRDACDGSLPRHLDRLHDIRVEGQHLLQMLQKVDIANPSAPEDSVEGDFQDGLAEEVSRRHGGRQRPLLLKVLLTDGIQAVCGIERRPIAALRQAIPGSKLVLGNRPLLRRGLLLLEPTNVEALCTLAQAGAVETLETAASSSGRDVAPQRSIASAASVAAGGAAQQAGNVSGAEGKVIRCYVARAAPDAGRAGLWLQLCDGEGFCEALLQPPALQQTLGAGDLDSLLGRARQLHGFFRLVQTGDTFQIESFRLGPSRQDLEQLERHLVAGAVETLETAASSSGRDVAPQRSIASAASVAAGGAAQQAGNVSGAEGKVIRCYVARAAPDAGEGDTFQIESFRRSPAAEELEMRLTDAPQIPYRDPNKGVLQKHCPTMRFHAVRELYFSLKHRFLLTV
ncbi:rmi1 [Symbiodinium sp. CCMP2592]|nr:rmi1 [Symbiodinium sp. CCMP2592]